MHAPGTSGSCRCKTSNPSSRTARMRRSWAEGSGAIGATEPLAAVGIELPSGVTQPSGGGPSEGASTRPGAPWPAGSGRGRAPAPGRRPAPRCCRGRRCRCAPLSPPRSTRSLGQLGCMRCHCDGAMRMSCSMAVARSWVTRATSSRRRPWRVVSSGGRAMPLWRPSSRYTVETTSGAPDRSARVAGPPGSVVRSPKKSTSMPPPPTSRSDMRVRMRPWASAAAAAAPAFGPRGMTSMPRASRRPTNQRASSGGSTGSTTADTGICWKVVVQNAAHSHRPRCGMESTTPLPAS